MSRAARGALISVERWGAISVAGAVGNIIEFSRAASRVDVADAAAQADRRARGVRYTARRRLRVPSVGVFAAQQNIPLKKSFAALCARRRRRGRAFFNGF